MKKSPLILLALAFCLSAVAQAKGKGRSGKKSRSRVQKTVVSPGDVELARLKKLYRKGVLRRDTLWGKLNQMEGGKLTRGSRASLLQMQAGLLFEDGYPVMGAIYATEALKMAANPLSPIYNRSWELLTKVSRVRPVQYLLEDLALSLKLKGRNPPSFKNDWNYIIGNALASKSRDKDAERFYKRVNLGNRYFLPASYQIAMIRYERGDLQNARAALNAILMRSSRDASPVSRRDKVEMWNYANMALGRIAYEERKFLTSARYFRKVTKTSPLYYDALFEQSWSLFMSGNPKHSLGTLYGVHSPYFKDIYNPEGRILEAIVYFWLCRYGDSRNALAAFLEKHGEAVESLSSFLDQRRYSKESAYRLFENLVAGVSGDSLGIPRDILLTAAERDTMLLVRDQLATALGERSRISYRGVWRHKKNIIGPMGRINKVIKGLRDDLGSQFVKELQAERSHYEDLYGQAQFLYLELLMSEKEQLLGRELHVDNKVTRVSDYDDIRGWGRKTQSWKSERKGEYWWDEVGFHLVSVEPKCNIQK